MSKRLRKRKEVEIRFFNYFFFFNLAQDQIATILGTVTHAHF